MITDMDNGGCLRRSAAPVRIFVDLTIEEQNIPVVATTAVSAFTAGVHEGRTRQRLPAAPPTEHLF